LFTVTETAVTDRQKKLDQSPPTLGTGLEQRDRSADPRACRRRKQPWAGAEQDRRTSDGRSSGREGEGRDGGRNRARDFQRGAEAHARSLQGWGPERSVCAGGRRNERQKKGKVSLGVEGLRIAS
jgi:hypothetical protein